MKKMIIMVGIPASGKSYWLNTHKQYFAKTNSIISRDEIRFSLVKEDEPYFSKEPEVYQKFIDQIKVSLSINEETYVDATHINERSRAKLFRSLGSALKNVEVHAIVFKVPLKVALNRNSQREGRCRVPDEAIKRMYSQFEVPTIDEGFDGISIWGREDGTVVEFIKE